jgi:hypothetical protein
LVASGELDVDLPALARAIDARLHLLHIMIRSKPLAELVVGDCVRINQYARPRYLLVVGLPCRRVRQRMGAAVFPRPTGRGVASAESCGPASGESVAITR